MSEQETPETEQETGTAPAKKRRGFGDVMSDIFLPMLPALIAAGILQGIVSILVAFGVLHEGMPTHTVLSTISTAIFYFLPFLIGASTAKAFNTSPYLAIAVVAFFLYPDMVDAMASDAPLSLFGIPIVKTTYTSSVIPIILMIWGMSYIHRWVQKIIPKLLATVLVPTITVALSTMLGLLVMGPIGAALTKVITWVVTTAQNGAPWLVPLLVGMFGALLISVGMSFALFPIAVAGFTAQGFDTVYGPGMLASNMALAGMALAVALKSKNTSYKSYSLTASATALLGVAQPALYGVAIPLRRPFLAVMSGGAAGGLVAGLTGFKVYGMAPAGLTSITLYVGDQGWGNLLSSLVVIVIAFGVAFLVAWFIRYEPLTDEQIAEITDSNSE
ncbi:PTS transporter subunit EIIC [Granulicoccus phenolivorans]|uniref:PTS transporter subunit EIIC n=1 Tax=Granulicoccus phenolivorans TaxID=266854 RepID=UPI00041031E0|nr:PTS transporter subunit EIIC [Granulicoccus phenolivorans]